MAFRRQEARLVAAIQEEQVVLHVVPERGHFALQIVLGAAERDKADAVRDTLSGGTQEKYDEATTYHDGKWLLLTVDADKRVDDVMRLLAVKRRSRRNEYE